MKGQPIVIAPHEIDRRRNYTVWQPVLRWFGSQRRQVNQMMLNRPVVRDNPKTDGLPDTPRGDSEQVDGRCTVSESQG